MTRRASRLVVLVLGPLLLASCAQASSTPDAGAQPGDVRGEWRLIELSRDGSRVPLPTDGEGTLDVRAGELGGTAFCNGFGSAYRLDGDALTLGALASTEKGCAPELMAAERAYLDALMEVDTVSVESGELLLRGHGAQLRFQRAPEAPVRDLVGTRWVLETLLHEDMASSTLGEPAVLVLAADGGLSGSTGCRALSGRWARTGELLVLPELRADGDCPADVRAQDEHVLTVLDGETRATVDGDLLTLTGGDGRALVYRAR